LATQFFKVTEGYINGVKPKLALKLKISQLPVHEQWQSVR